MRRVALPNLSTATSLCHKAVKVKYTTGGGREKMAHGVCQAATKTTRRESLSLAPIAILRVDPESLSFQIDFPADLWFEA